MTSKRPRRPGLGNRVLELPRHPGIYPPVHNAGSMCPAPFSEALSAFDPEDKAVARVVIESLILRYQSKRWIEQKDQAS